MRNFLRINCLLFLLVSGLSFIIPSSAPAVDSASIAPLALYDGTDRQQRLLAEAKKEGGFLLYTSSSPKDLPALVGGFEKKYGIKVNTWRASANDVLRRVLTEASANRFDCDAIVIGAVEMEALRREKMLQAAKSPYFKDLIPLALTKHREWVATHLVFFAQVYNTEKVKKEELPKVYRDLLDPRWKGRLGIEQKSPEWFYTLVKAMGEERGLKFFRDLVAINKPSVRDGQSVLNNMVVSGEVPFALAIYNYMPAQSKQAGAPVDWFALDPVIARASAVGLAKRSSHPSAAMLFYDYMLSDAQQLLAKVHYIPTVKTLESPLKGRSITMIDPASALDEYEKATTLYDEIIMKK